MEIERFHKRLGPPLARLYRFVDVSGWLSNFIADPVSQLQSLLPSRVIRLFHSHTQKPLISVIIATRNNATTIAKSINSLLGQTYSNIEIIVIDDCSQDESIEIIRSIAEHEPRLQFFSNRKKLGTGISRNIGLKLAKGDYVTFQDGDDYSAPFRMAVQLYPLMNGKTLSLCNYNRVDNEGRCIELNAEKRTMKCIISMMFPREPVIENVGYFLDGCVSEDSDYYERIKIAFGAECEAIVFRTLYKALFRTHSSFFADAKLEISGSDKISFIRSKQSIAEDEEIRKRHAMMREGKLPHFVSFDDKCLQKP